MSDEKIVVPQSQIEAMEAANYPPDERSRFVAAEEAEDSTEPVETEEVDEVTEDDIEIEEVEEVIDDTIDEGGEDVSGDVDVETEEVDSTPSDVDVEEEFDEGLKRKKISGKWHYAVYADKGGDPEWVDAKNFRRLTSSDAHATRKFQQLAEERRKFEEEKAANKDLADVMNMFAPKTEAKPQTTDVDPLDAFLNPDATATAQPQSNDELSALKAEVAKLKQASVQATQVTQLRQKAQAAALSVNSFLAANDLYVPEDSWAAVETEIMRDSSGDSAKAFALASDPTYLMKKYNEVYAGRNVQGNTEDAVPDSKVVKKPPKRTVKTRVNRAVGEKSDVAKLEQSKESLQKKLNNPELLISESDRVGMAVELQSINQKLNKLTKG